MIYQEDEEEIFYSFPQFKRINYKDFILLKKDQKILFVDLNDLDQLENDIKRNKDQEEFIFNFFIYRCYRLFIIGLTTWLFSYLKTI